MPKSHGRRGIEGGHVMPYGHDPEAGHQCPKCNKKSLCLIEDGFCENQGECDNCIIERYTRDAYDEYWED